MNVCLSKKGGKTNLVIANAETKTRGCKKRWKMSLPIKFSLGDSDNIQSIHQNSIGTIIRVGLRQQSGISHKMDNCLLNLFETTQKVINRYYSRKSVTMYFHID